MSIKHELRKLLWKFGYDISRFTPKHQSYTMKIARKKQILDSFKIDTILDIGANEGQFAQWMRGDVGFSHHILSFEPLSAAFELLRANAKDDNAWEVFNFAIGDAEEKREINIAGKYDSSSLLNMLPSHLKFAPHSKNIGKEMIDVKTLDTLFRDLCRSAENVYLKIDTQGYESKVLKGAENSLPHINTVQMEMSLIPLYDGELLFNELYTLMNKKGYVLIEIEKGFSDPTTGQILQIDGIFHRF